MVRPECVELSTYMDQECRNGNVLEVLLTVDSQRHHVTGSNASPGLLETATKWLRWPGMRLASEMGTGLAPRARAFAPNPQAEGSAPPGAQAQGVGAGEPVGAGGQASSARGQHSLGMMQWRLISGWLRPGGFVDFVIPTLWAIVHSQVIDPYRESHVSQHHVIRRSKEISGDLPATSKYSIALPTWLTISELWFVVAALARWGGHFSGLPLFAVEPWAGRRV